MSQDTDHLLSQIAQDIDSKEVEQARKTSKRVDTAYGADGRGLIAPTLVVQVADSDELY